MTLHFIYASDHDNMQPRAPHSITRNLYRFLSKRTKTQYHKWDSERLIDLNPNDIVLGHPHYDPNTIMQQIFRRGKPCKARCLIHPFHHRRVEDNLPFDFMAHQADRIFGICGPYWYDTMNHTVFAHWKPKMVRLDMAVDGEFWQYEKKRFNRPGQRGIVYIGSAAPQKNWGYLDRIVRRLPDIQFRWYGGNTKHPLNRYPNMRIFGWCDFSDRRLVRDICGFGDIFLNVSISDANPTTLLEFGLASGLIPICTETSGYYNDPHFVNMPHDLDAAVRIIRQWLQKPSEELRQMSLRNRQECVNRYTWERFCNRIWTEIAGLI